MSITPLNTIITLPEKCPLQEVQGNMIEVYEVKDFNGKNKQNFKIKDASGAIVSATAWAHDDVSFYKGKDVIIKAGPKGGLSVNNYQGKPGISVSSTCTFQTVNGGAAPAPKPTQAPTEIGNVVTTILSHPANNPTIPGVTIGMAINNACQSLTAQGLPLTKGSVWQLASMLVKVSRHMEQGRLYAPPEAPVAQPSNPALNTAPAPVTQDGGPDEDVPF